jgi:monoamine oxidase
MTAPNGANGANASTGYLPAPTPGPTFWQQEGKLEYSDYRSTESLPAHTDILVIGAGYAGISTAYHLLEEGTGSSITILEARGVCSGATGRNGGHLRPDLYGHIPTYIDRAGLEAAAEIAEFEIAHVPAMKQFVREQGIDCDFSLCRTIDVWCNDESARKAKAVYDMMVGYRLAYMEDVIFYTGEEAEGVSLSLSRLCIRLHANWYRSPASKAQRLARHTPLPLSGHTSSLHT